MEETPKSYDMTALMRLTPEFLLGDLEHPGPLVTLAYPDVLRMREVSQDAKRITDMDYFWKLKTRRDFGAENKYPQKRNWKEEYLSYGEKMAPELVKASKEGNGARVRELLDLGVNPNTRTKYYGYTALIWASNQGHRKIVEMLIEAGAEVDIQDEDRETALIGASLEGRTEIVEMLLAAGAEVNLRNKYGGAALMRASLNGHRKIVEMLIEAGAEVNFQNNWGDTALDNASARGHTEIVEMLEEAMRTPASLSTLSRRTLRREGRAIPGYLQ